MKEEIYIKGLRLISGDRVKAFDIFDGWVSGTLYFEDKEWFVKYDDGQEFLVVDVDILEKL